MLPVLRRFFFTEKFQPFRAAAFQNLLLICMSTMARLNLPGNSGAFPLKRLRISSCWKASEFSVKTGITVRMCNWHQSPTGRFLEWVEISAICREAGKKLAIFAVPPVVPAGRKGGSLFFFSKRFPSLLYFPFRMKMNPFFLAICRCLSDPVCGPALPPNWTRTSDAQSSKHWPVQEEKKRLIAFFLVWTCHRTFADRCRSQKAFLGACIALAN